jgi:hypothetical protein
MTDLHILVIAAAAAAALSGLLALCARLAR